MQREFNDNDPRVQRTREKLQQALFDLTIEKGFAGVTVRDIAKKARVNRSTFYRHYLDIYDLLDKHLNDLQHQAEIVAQSPDTMKDGQVPAGLLLVLNHVAEYADFYRVMLGANGDPRFTHRFRQLTENRYRYLFSKQPKQPDKHIAPDDMKLSYISHASIGGIVWWLEHNQPCTSEQLAVWLGRLNMTSAGFIPSVMFDSSD